MFPSHIDVSLPLSLPSRLSRIIFSGHDPRWKGCRFGHWSGHVPRLWVQTLVGACTGGSPSMFLCHIDVPLLSSLPLSLKPIKTYPLVRIKNNNNPKAFTESHVCTSLSAQWSEFFHLMIQLTLMVTSWVKQQDWSHIQPMVIKALTTCQALG